MLTYFTHQKEKFRSLHNLEETVTLEDMERETPKSYATLDNHQAHHQSTVVEFEGKIAKQSISILIDPGSTHSYVSPKLYEIFSLGKSRHNKPWLVQLAT